MPKRNFLLPLLLCLCLLLPLSACSLGTAPQGDSLPLQEETDSEYLSYDKSDEESLQVQREFDELANAIFCDAAQSSSLYLHFLLKDPEAYGIRSTASPFGEYSLVKLQEESDHLQMLFDTLNQISYNRLTSDQQFLYALLRDYLEVSLPAKGLELYSQPLSETIGVQAQLPILLSEYRIASKEEAEEYLSLLEAVPSLFQEIMAFERQKTEAGLGLDDGSIDRIIASCEASMTAPASHPLTETFEERISQLSDLSAEEKEKYLEQNTKVITEVFIPAYQSLIDELTALKGKGGNSGGLCAFPDGKEYYEYLVKSETGTSYSMEELYKQLQVRLDSDLRTISKMVTANPDLREQMNSYLYSVSEPTDILSNLQAEMTEDFPALADSSSTLTLKYVPKALESSLSPAFFLLPPIDDLQNNTIYINRQSVNQTTSLYSTLAHEGMPGHLYQTLYYMQKNRSPLTRILSCSGYIEGWATYSEYYSYSFDNGLHSDLQQLLAHNSAAILGLSALLDYNVNYKNWDKNDVADYLNNNYGIDDAAVAEDMFYSMVDCPANYLTYYTGYLEIMDLKETAEKELGDNFDIKEFHTFLLDMAPASFRVIRQYFNSWLLSQKA